MIRKEAVAGKFYPSEKIELEKIITGFIDDAEDFKIEHLKAIIAPHAGYVYSGPVAGYAYRQLKNLLPQKYNIFLIGPAHFVYTSASVGLFESFQTPLGTVRVNQSICKELLKNPVFDPSAKAHLLEHSLEVQLPFLQTTLADFEIVPILLGEINPQDISEILFPYFGKPGNMFVFSSDLSHYMPYEAANKTDSHSLKIITDKSIENEIEIDACGNLGIKVAMRLANKTDSDIKLLNYRNSGDTAGDKKAVVGYASLAIF